MFLYTNKKISPQGKVNEKDLKKIIRDSVIFLAAPVLIYTAQLSGSLTDHQVLSLVDFVPTSMTIGAIQGWAIGIVVNFILKLQNNQN